MRRYGWMALVIGVGLATIARPDDTAKQDSDKLQGNWQVVQAEEGGKPNEELKAFRLSFKGDKIIVRFNNEMVTGTFELDPSKNPKQINVQPSEEKKPVLGLYKIEGKRLTLCMGDTGEERPKEFKTQVGRKTVLWVLEPIAK